MKRLNIFSSSSSKLIPVLNLMKGNYFKLEKLSIMKNISMVKIQFKRKLILRISLIIIAMDLLITVQVRERNQYKKMFFRKR